MIIAAFVLLAGAALLLAITYDQRNASRAALDVAQENLVRVITECAASRTERDEARSERDAAYIERNAAIEAVRWVPLTSAEINRLAKTGCAACFGAGYTDTQHASGVLRKLCDCVQKKMRADRKYGFGDNGTPLRLAIPTDNLDATKLSLVGPNGAN